MKRLKILKDIDIYIFGNAIEEYYHRCFNSKGRRVPSDWEFEYDIAYLSTRQYIYSKQFKN